MLIMAGKIKITKKQLMSKLSIKFVILFTMTIWPMQGTSQKLTFPAFLIASAKSTEAVHLHPTVR
jgi:hypothetical protein